MIALILALLSVLLSNPESLCAESEAPDYLLEIKQIKIPQYPDAFNPSIIRWNGSLLLCFRVYTSTKSQAPHIGFCWLDEEFQPKGDPFVIHHSFRRMNIPTSLGEDPRMIFGKDRLWISYNCAYKKTRRMALAELQWNGLVFSFHPLDYWLQFDQENPERVEKNWVPFFVEGESHPFFSYSLFPHRVFSKSGSNCCQTKAYTELQPIGDWGEIRGGTPALNLGDCYLGFFHSSRFIPQSDTIQGVLRHYSVGAYLFSAKSPFELTHMSTHPLPIADFLPPSHYKELSNCEGIYPGGFIYDSKFIWLAFGRYDHEMWIVKLDQKKLLSSLTKLPPL